MSSESILKLLVAASIFIVVCEAVTHVVPLNATTKQLIEEAKASKHPRCFTPYRINCNHTNYPGYDFNMTRWYYSATKKVCFPMYLPRGENKQCPGIIDWIVDLPYTKKECEDLCGEPCIIVHTNNKTESGICMMDCGLVVPKHVQLPCLPSDFGCCPRDYVPSSSPAMRPYTEEDSRLPLFEYMKSTINNLTVRENLFT